MKFRNVFNTIHSQSYDTEKVNKLDIVPKFYSFKQMYIHEQVIIPTYLCLKWKHIKNSPLSYKKII